MNKKLYKSSRRLFFEGGAILIALWAISFFSGELHERALETNILLLMAAMFLLLFFENEFTYINCLDNRRLQSKVALGFGFNIDIMNITKIKRGQTFRIKSWGHRLEIHHILNETEYTEEIWENRYNAETLKELLIDLKRINPSIELDEAYKKFIKGEIETPADIDTDSLWG